MINANDPRLRTLHDILSRKLGTPDQWAAEIEGGWVGSDGSTMSTDTIWGVRIGMTTAAWTALPAPQHDLDYRTLRRLLATGRITYAQWVAGRLAADEALRDRMLAKAPEAFVLVRPSYRRRCWIRFEAVQHGAAWAAKPKHDEIFPGAPKAA